MKKKQNILVVLAVTLLGAGVANATVISSFVGDGVSGPIAQGWTWSDDGTNNPARYYTNETINGTAYDSWVFDSVAGDKGTYLDYYSDQSNALHAAGWTVTYVSRTVDATSPGYETLTIRDTENLFQFYFVQDGPGGDTDGVWVNDNGPSNILAKPMDLADDYHTFQVTCELATPGSYSATDVISLYVDGVVYWEGARSDFGGSTLGRTDIADAATGGAGLFMVNKLVTETGVHPVNIVDPVFISYVAPGSPANQNWTWDSTTSFPNDPVRYDTNETVNGISYDAWVFDSVPDDKGGYYDYASWYEKALQEHGWTVTYVSRTTYAPNLGYHDLKFRDKTSIFQLYFVEGSGSIPDGLWINDSGTGSILVKAMDLSDDYHTVKMGLTPETPGSFGPNDVVKVYVDGTEEYSGVRSDFTASTYAVRAELYDNGSSSGGQFMVNKFTVELGINVFAPPAPPIGDIAVEYLGASGLSLTWNTTNGYDYTLWEKSDLIAGSWSTNQSGIPGEAGSTTVTTAVDAVQAFFKVTSE